MRVELRLFHILDGFSCIRLDLVQDLVILGDLRHVDLVEFIISANIQYVGFVLVLTHPLERRLKHFLVEFCQCVGRFFYRT